VKDGQGIPPEGSKAKVVPVLLPVSQVPGSGASQLLKVDEDLLHKNNF